MFFFFKKRLRTRHTQRKDGVKTQNAAVHKPTREAWHRSFLHGLQEEPTLLTPQSRASSIQPWEDVHVFCWSYRAVVLCSGSPSKLAQAFNWEQDHTQGVPGGLETKQRNRYRETGTARGPSSLYIFSYQTPLYYASPSLYLQQKEETQGEMKQRVPQQKAWHPTEALS